MNNTIWRRANTKKKQASFYYFSHSRSDADVFFVRFVGAKIPPPSYWKSASARRFVVSFCFVPPYKQHYPNNIVRALWNKRDSNSNTINCCDIWISNGYRRAIHNQTFRGLFYCFSQLIRVKCFLFERNQRTSFLCAFKIHTHTHKALAYPVGKKKSKQAKRYVVYYVSSSCGLMWVSTKCKSSEVM